MEMNILRTLLERLSRERVVKRTITVDNRPTPLYVSPDAQLKYLKPGSHAFDQDLIKIAENYLQVDSTVWDIGANVGVFTFAAASVARQGTIVSVEADIWLAALLRRTARLKEYREQHICVIPTAISETNAIASFMIAKRGRASNALVEARGHSEMGGVREKQYVPTLTLDTLLQTCPPPDFIKIDIEGAEMMALKGATHIIHDIRPLFYIEVATHLSQEIFDIFHSKDYMAFSPEARQLESSCTPNTFFIPKERLQSFTMTSIV